MSVTDTAVPLPYVVCDGTERLRFRAWIADGGQALYGSTVRIENGSTFLMVDGTCTYWLRGWTNDPLVRDRPIVTGKLSAAVAMTLERELPLDALGSVDCGPATVADGGRRIIRAEGSTASCDKSNARFDAAWARVAAVVAEVGSVGDGRPLDGAMRIAADQQATLTPSTPTPYAWPVDLPLDSFLIPAGPTQSIPGVSRLVTDPGAAAAFRALRDRYLADRTAMPASYSNWFGMQVVSGATTASVYLRDALPYEDAQGLITF